MGRKLVTNVFATKYRAKKQQHLMSSSSLSASNAIPLSASELHGYRGGKGKV